MKKMPLLISIAALIIATAFAAQEKTDAAMIARIRSEGLDRSKVMETFDHLVNVIGPRLTASPAYKTAVDWTRDKMANLGFDNVHLEPWEFGRGWQMERLSIEMLEPRYLPLIGYANGWSPSTKGKLVATPVWLGNPSEDIQKYAGKISGAIVMSRPIQDDFVRDDRSRQAATTDGSPFSLHRCNRRSGSVSTRSPQCFARNGLA